MVGKCKKRLLSALRIGVVLASLLALGVSGASAATRAFDSATGRSPAHGSESGQTSLIPGPPSPDEARDETASHSRPDTEQKACSIVPLSCNGTQGNERFRHLFDSRIASAPSARNDCASTAARSSTSLISSALGRQFTLLGAKPSGTG
jgi:hypothetical protein